MNIQEMLQKSVTFHQNFESKNNIYLRPETRLKMAYTNLDVVLSKLADEVGWFRMRKKADAGNKREFILEYFVEGINYYLLIANLKNWNKPVLISDDNKRQLSQAKKTSDLSKLYLSLKNMLFNSYFVQRQNDFVYSWKLYLKLGLSDLNLTEEDIIKEFNMQTNVD